MPTTLSRIEIRGLARPGRAAWIFALLGATAWAQRMPSDEGHLPPGFIDEEVARFDSRIPTALLSLPDGRFVVGFLSGEGFLWSPEEGLAAEPFVNTDIEYAGAIEEGLLGATLDPDFAATRAVWIVITTRPKLVGRRIEPREIQVRRFQLADRGATPHGMVAADGEVIWSVMDANQGSRVHNGGGLAFGPDGKLYLGLGEDATPPVAQDVRSVRGKILRLNPDGSIPEDNPVVMGVRGPVYALGLRNPFRLFWDRGTGQLFACDTGQQLWEELNEIVPGGNYGWPIVDGPLGDNPGVRPPENYREPFHAYRHGTAPLDGMAIVSGLVYEGEMLPATYRGEMFITELGLFGNGKIFKLDRKPSGAFGRASVFQWTKRDYGYTDIVEAPDGSLHYLLTRIVDKRGSIRRIAYSPPDDPPIPKLEAEPTRGRAPLNVRFRGEVVDEETPRFRVELSDGSRPNSLEFARTFSRPGYYQARLIATDRHGWEIVDSVEIEVLGQAAIEIDATILDAGADPPRPVAGVARALDASARPIALPDGGPAERRFGRDGRLQWTQDGLESDGERVSIEIESPGMATRRIALPTPSRGRAELSGPIFISPLALRGTVATEGEASASKVDLALLQDRGGGFYQPYALAGARDAVGFVSATGIAHVIPIEDDGGFYLPLRSADAGTNFLITANRERSASGHGIRSEAVRAPRPRGAAFVGLRLPSTAAVMDCNDLLLPGTRAVAYREIQEIFDRSCVGCHGLIQPYEGLTLADGFSYSSIVERTSRQYGSLKLVDASKPGDRAKNSYLLEKVNCLSPSAGGTMPPIGRISGLELQLLARWIRGGARPTRDAPALRTWSSATEGISPMIVDLRAGAEGSGAPFAFVWEIDGRPMEGDAVRQVFVIERGEARVSVRATLRSVAGVELAAEELTIDIRAPEIDRRNKPPTAHLVGATGVAPRLPISLDAARSSDADGRVLAYLWDFDDDGRIDAATLTPTVSYAFAEPGERRVRLTVVDDKNARDSTTATFVVGR